MDFHQSWVQENQVNGRSPHLQAWNTNRANSPNFIDRTDEVFSQSSFSMNRTHAMPTGDAGYRLNPSATIHQKMETMLLTLPELADYRIRKLQTLQQTRLHYRVQSRSIL